MNQSFLVLLSLLIGGGSGDLLDYVQTQTYWDAKDVRISVETMLQEAAPPAAPDLSKLIGDMASADPKTRDAAAEGIFKLGAAALPALHKSAGDADPAIADRSRFLIERLQPIALQAGVRRLMALRTLGELRDAKAIPFLESQLGSEAMFAGDYARVAIGRIENQPATRPSAAAVAIDTVWMLPANCRAVAQIVPKQTGPVDLSEAAARLHPNHGPDGATVLANTSRVALSVAEAMGNMRLDALDVGLSENINENHGCVTVIASGQFSAESAAHAARETGAVMRNVDGADLLEVGREGTMFFPSDHLMVLMLSPSPQETDVKQMLETIKSGRQPLKASPEIAGLAQATLGDSHKPRHALWIAAKVTDAYKQLPGVDGFSSLTLACDEEKDSLICRFRGECADAERASAAAANLNGYAAPAAAEFESRSKTAPQNQAAADFANTIKFQAEDSAVIGTASVSQTPDAILARYALFSSLGNPFRIRE